MDVFRDLLFSCGIPDPLQQSSDKNFSSICCIVCKEDCILQCLILPCGHFVHKTFQCQQQLKKHPLCSICSLDISTFVITNDAIWKTSVGASIENIMNFMDTCGSTLTTDDADDDNAQVDSNQNAQSPHDLLSKIVLQPPMSAPVPVPVPSLIPRFTSPVFSTFPKPSIMNCAQKRSMRKREKDFCRLFSTTVGLGSETRSESTETTNTTERTKTTETTETTNTTERTKTTETTNTTERTKTTERTRTTRTTRTTKRVKRKSTVVQVEVDVQNFDDDIYKRKASIFLQHLGFLKQ